MLYKIKFFCFYLNLYDVCYIRFIEHDKILKFYLFKQMRWNLFTINSKFSYYFFYFNTKACGCVCVSMNVCNATHTKSRTFPIVQLEIKRYANRCTIIGRKNIGSHRLQSLPRRAITLWDHLDHNKYLWKS